MTPIVFFSLSLSLFHFSDAPSDATFVLNGVTDFVPFEVMTLINNQSVNISCNYSDGNPPVDLVQITLFTSEVLAFNASSVVVTPDYYYDLGLVFCYARNTIGSSVALNLLTVMCKFNLTCSVMLLGIHFFKIYISCLSNQL